MNEAHKRHRLGINIDISDFRGMSQADWSTFESIAWANGATKVIHEVGHYHLEF